VPIRINVAPQAWGTGLAAPAFAGDAIVWGRAVDAGYQVLVRRGRHTTRRTIEFEGMRDGRVYVPRLRASPSRFGLDLLVYACPGYRGCEGGVPYDVFSLTATAPLSGSRTALTKGCTAGDIDESGGFETATAVDVSGDVVAWDDCESGVHVRDLAPGADPAGRDYPGGDVRVAGSFVAIGDYPESITVSNWRTGEDLFTVDGVYGLDHAANGIARFDLGEDGTLAYITNAYKLAWASPAAPTPHPVAEADALPGRVVVAGGRIAYSHADINYAAPIVDVRALDGTLLMRANAAYAITSPDFDGRRLTWVAAPCATGGLVVWDGEGAPPAPPAGPCPVPRIVHDSARVDRRNRLSVRLACPERPWLGCAVTVEARNPMDGPNLVGQADPRYWVSDYGNEERVRVPKGSHATCRGRHGVPRTRIVIHPGGRQPARTHVVAVHGAHRDLPDCEA
jgi:hypothetical protein